MWEQRGDQHHQPSFLTASCKRTRWRDRLSFPQVSTQKSELEQAPFLYQTASFCIERFSPSIKESWRGGPRSEALDLNFNQATLPEYFITLDCLEEIILHIKESQAIGFATSVPARWRSQSWHVMKFAGLAFFIFWLLNGGAI